MLFQLGGENCFQESVEHEGDWLPGIVSKVGGFTSALVLCSSPFQESEGLPGPSGSVPATHWAPLGPSPHLTCGNTAVHIETEDGIRADGSVREEAVTDLQWEGGEATSAVGTVPRLPR